VIILVDNCTSINVRYYQISANEIRRKPVEVGPLYTVFSYVFQKLFLGSASVTADDKY